MRLADLYLGPPEAALLGLHCLRHQLGILHVDPSALGVVALDRILGPPGKKMKRKTCLAAAQIPKGRVNGGKRNRSERAHGRGVDGEEKVAPNPLDLVRLTMEQEGNQVIVKKLDDRRSASADGIAVTSSDDSVGVRDAHHRRLLALEALNSVGALHLGRQIYLQDLNRNDFRHLNFPLPTNNCHHRSGSFSRSAANAIKRRSRHARRLGKASSLSNCLRSASTLRINS